MSDKKPLAQACKEAKGPIEYSNRAIRDAKEINELATLLQGDENTRTIAAAIYLVPGKKPDAPKAAEPAEDDFCPLAR